MALVLSRAAAVAGLLIVRRRLPLETLKEQCETASVAHAALAALAGVIL